MCPYGSRVSPLARAPAGPAPRGAAGCHRTVHGAPDAGAGGPGRCAGLHGCPSQGPRADGPPFHGPRDVPGARPVGEWPDCPPGSGAGRATRSARTRAGRPGHRRAADLTRADAASGCSAPSDSEGDTAGTGDPERTGISAWRIPIRLERRAGACGDARAHRENRRSDRGGRQARRRERGPPAAIPRQGPARRTSRAAEHSGCASQTCVSTRRPGRVSSC